ncbi:MAG: DUF2384 domain-containing protein [Cyclobacteriaceae bacterium]
MEYKDRSNDPLSARMVSEVAIEYGMTKLEMATLLGVSEKTYYNLMKSSLDAHQGDRFSYMHNILEEGKHTFNGLSNFKDWLHTEQSTFGGATPLQKMSSLVGAQEVLAEMTKIKHGIFA